MLAGIACRVDSGPAIERRHHQAAVLAEHPLVQMAGQFARLLPGVFLKRRTVFDHFGHARPAA